MKQNNGLSLKPLQSGQIWKMDDANLEIQEVGKLLVHYKLSRGNAKRVPISLSGIDAVEKFLKENGAVLARKTAGLKVAKVKAVSLLLLGFMAPLLSGCIAFPPLISVEHKDAPSNANANAELMRRLDSIDQRLNQLEQKVGKQ
jgi:hypothetical protein